jgi:potassium channel subfamily K
MTVFISNLGDTAVKWLEEVTVWVSKWTILPEKDSDQIDSKQAELQTREMSNRISEKNVNAHEHRNVGDQIQASPRSNTPDSRPRRRQSKSEPHGQPDHSSKRRVSGVLEHDVEHFGNKIDDFEKSEGREGSLAGRLAREISHLAKDLRHKPPKKYTWDQWSVWLRMLGERDDENFLPPTSRRPALRSTPGGTPVQILTPASLADFPNSASTVPKAAPAPEGPLPAPHKTDRSVQNVSLEHLSINLPRASAYNDAGRQNQSKSDFHSTAQTEEVEWRWTWLGDHGPLFSPLTETEWILEKLCFRLEEVLEDEIREAHAVANERNRMPFVHDQ